MNRPQRREEVRYIHIDTAVFHDNDNKSQYKIKMNTDLDTNNHSIPIQDYNNVSKIELKVFKFAVDLNEKYEYVILKIKNIDGHIDSNTKTQDATAVIYFDSTKPTFFDDQNTFSFSPPLANLNKVDIELLDTNGDFIDPTNHSFVLKLTYIEGNMY